MFKVPDTENVFGLLVFMNVSRFFFYKEMQKAMKKALMFRKVVPIIIIFCFMTRTVGRIIPVMTAGGGMIPCQSCIMKVPNNFLIM